MSEASKLDLGLTSLGAPPLDEAFSTRVLKLARAQLAPPLRAATEPALSLERLRLAVRSAAIPALLTSAAICRTGLTVRAAAEIYAVEPDTEPKAEPNGK